MTAHFDRLMSLIRAGHARIGIVGLGYVGLPLAYAFTEKGFRVLGFEADSNKIDSIRNGCSYLSHFPAARVFEMRDRHLLEATSQMDRLTEPDVVIICVPTPLTEMRDPDLHFLEAAARDVAQCLRSGQLVILESTAFPGTTRQVVLPALETSGLVCGEEFFLAFSPEREDPGNERFTVGSIPKVVGGIDMRSLDLAAALYDRVAARAVRVSTPEVAEAAKITENIYREVNIALVNELKMLYDRMGIDVWEVIDAAKTKPFGFTPFYPGPGLGGPCIPKDPFYMAWIARRYDMPTRFIELAGDVNLMMPGFVVGKIADALNDARKPINGSRIAILGAAYKPNVGDSRLSPAYALISLLIEKGAEVTYHDPHLPELRAESHFPAVRPMRSRPLTADYLLHQDCVVIVTDHAAFDWRWIVNHSSLVVDTRGATRHLTEQRDRIVAA